MGKTWIVPILPDPLLPVEGEGKRRMDFLVKSRSQSLGSGDVTDAFRQWARCITYYRDYYEDSYLMPLVVSSLTGDASDVFDWILSLNHGEPQDLTTLLQMLKNIIVVPSPLENKGTRLRISTRSLMRLPSTS